MTIHKNYLLLKDNELMFVDRCISDMLNPAKLKFPDVPLNNADGAERVAEALATWVIDSRKN